MKQIKNILLVDDNEDDNFIHSRVIRDTGLVEKISIAFDGRDALDFLTRKKDLGNKGEGFTRPNIICLDINMPRMDGWEFLEAYETLSEENKADILVVMMSNSENPDDRVRASKYKDVHQFTSKPLSLESLRSLVETYHSISMAQTAG